MKRSVGRRTVSVVTLATLLTFVVAAASHADWAWNGTGYTSNGDVLAMHFADDVMLIGREGGGIIRSTDDGVTWTASDSGISATAVYDFQAKGDAIFAATGSAVYRTDNIGESWTRVSAGLPPTSAIRGLEVLGESLYAMAGSSGVFRSNDDGVSWYSVSTGIQTERLTSIAAVGDSLFVTALDGRGVFRSDDGGASWSAAREGLLGASGKHITAMGGSLFVSTYVLGGVYRSDNMGASWYPANSGLDGYYLDLLAVAGDRLYVTTGSGGVFRSTDMGASWTPFNRGFTGWMNTHPLPYIRSLTVSGDTLFAGAGGSGLDPIYATFISGVHPSIDIASRTDEVGTGSSTIAVDIANHPARFHWQASDVTDTVYESAGNGTVVDSTTLELGSLTFGHRYTVYVHLVDDLDEPLSPEAWDNLTFTFEGAPQSIEVTSPVDLSTVSTPVTVTVDINSHPLDFVYRIYDLTILPGSPSEVQTGRVTGGTAFPLHRLISGREYLILVSLVDGEGNPYLPSLDDRIRFTYDGPPAIDITAPTDGGIVTTPANVTVSKLNPADDFAWFVFDADDPSPVPLGTGTVREGDNFALPMLLPGHTYRVAVHLVDEKGDFFVGDLKDEVAFTYNGPVPEASIALLHPTTETVFALGEPLEIRVAVANHPGDWAWELFDITGAAFRVDRRRVETGDLDTIPTPPPGRRYRLVAYLVNSEGLPISAALSDSVEFTVTATSHGLVLEGGYLKIGINADGSLIDTETYTGIRFDPTGSGNFTSKPDWITPGTPLEAFSVKIGSTIYRNQSPSGGSAIPGVLFDTSHDDIKSAEWVAIVGPGVELHQTISFRVDSPILRFDEFFVNRTGTTQHVRYLRNLDPDQAQQVGGGYATKNDVVDVSVGKLIVAETTNPGTLGLGATGLGDAVAFTVSDFDVSDAYGSLSTNDPDTVLTTPRDPNGMNADIGINIAFDLGMMDPGARRSFSFYMIPLATKTAVVSAFNDLAGGIGSLEPIKLAGVGFNSQLLVELARQVVGVAVDSTELSATDKSVLAQVFEHALLAPVLPDYPNAPPLFSPNGNVIVGDNFGNPLTIGRHELKFDLAAHSLGVVRTLATPKFSVGAFTSTAVDALDFALRPAEGDPIVVPGTLVTDESGRIPYRFSFDAQAGLAFLGHWLGAELPHEALHPSTVNVRYALTSMLPEDATALEYLTLPLAFTGLRGLWVAEEPVLLSPGYQVVYYFEVAFDAPIPVPGGDPVSEWLLPDPTNLQWLSRGAFDNVADAVSRYGLDLETSTPTPLNMGRFASLMLQSLISGGDVALASTFFAPGASSGRVWFADFPTEALSLLPPGTWMLEAKGFNAEETAVASSRQMPVRLGEPTEATVNLSTVFGTLAAAGARPTRLVAGVVTDEEEVPLSAEANRVIVIAFAVPDDEEEAARDRADLIANLPTVVREARGALRFDPRVNDVYEATLEAALGDGATMEEAQAVAKQAADRVVFELFLPVFEARFREWVHEFPPEAMVGRAFPDAEGRFGFELPVGRYLIAAIAPRFAVEVMDAPVPLTGEAPFTHFAMKPYNTPPHLGPLPTMVLRGTLPSTIWLLVNDEENDPISVLAESSEHINAAVFENAEGLFLTVASEPDFYGTETITLVLSDGGEPVRVPFVVRVVLNRPPTIASVDDQTVTAGASKEVFLAAEDLDGDPIFFTAIAGDLRLAAVASPMGAGARVTLIASPDLETPADKPIRVTVFANDVPEMRFLPLLAVGGDVNFGEATLTEPFVRVKVLDTGVAVDAPVVDGEFVATLMGGSMTPVAAVGSTILVELWDGTEPTPLASEVTTVTPEVGFAASLVANLTVGDFDDVPVIASTASFNVFVTPSSHVPVAHPLSLSTGENTPIEFTLLGFDPDEDILTYRATTLPSHGTLTLDGAMAVYTPDVDFVGVDDFLFVVNDGDEDSAPAKVTLLVGDISEIPVAFPAEYTVGEDAPFELTLYGAKLGGGDLFFEITQMPEHGTLTGEGAHRVYTPDDGFTGADEFYFAVSDGVVTGLAARVGVYVTAEREAPYFLTGSSIPVKLLSLTVEEGGMLLDLPIPVVDPDGDSLSFGLQFVPSSGNFVSFDDDAETFSYEARLGFSGTDFFAIFATDGENFTDPASPLFITITVTPSTGRPIITALEPIETKRAQTVEVALLAGPTGVPFVFEIVKPPEHGTALLVGDLLRYTPDRDFSGDDTMQYVAKNGVILSEVATLTFRVEDSNEPARLNEVAVFPTSIRVRQGAAPRRRELAGPPPLFVDPDTDVVYTVASTDPTVVDATLDGTALVMTFGEPGVAAVTIGAETADEFISFLVEVTSSDVANEPPDVEFVSAQRFAVGETNRFSIPATDPDGDALSFSVGSVSEFTTPITGDGDLIVTVEPGTGNVEMKVSEQASRARRWSVILAVADEFHPAVEVEVIVQVERTNKAPVIAVDATATAKVGEPTNIVVTATDTDAGAVLSIRADSLDDDAAVLAGLPAFNASEATVDGSTAKKTFTFTPSEALDGRIITLLWTASDGELVTGASTEVVVGEVTNRPPVFAAIPVQTAKEGGDWKYKLSATDPEKQPITYGLSHFSGGAGGLAEVPEGITLNPETGDLSWTGIPFDASGSLVIGVTASDGERTTASSFVVVIADANRAPEFVSPVTALEVPVGIPTLWIIEGSDPDGDDVSLALVGLPTWARTVSVASGEAVHQEIEFTAPADAKKTSFVARLTDPSRAKTEVTVALTIGAAPNRPPRIRRVLPSAGVEGEKITFAVEAEDPDGDELALTAAPLPEGATFESGAFTWTPPAGSAATSPYVISIAADDGKGGTAETTARVEVRLGANLPPRLGALGKQRVAEGGELVVNLLEGAVDPNGDPMTVTFTGLPEGRFAYDSATAVLTFSPQLGDAGVYPVQLRVSDGRGAETGRAIPFVVTRADAVVGAELAVSSVLTDPNPGMSSDEFMISAVVQIPEGVVMSAVEAKLTFPDATSRSEALTFSEELAPGLALYSTTVRLAQGEYGVAVTAIAGDVSRNLTGAPLVVKADAIEVVNLTVTSGTSDPTVVGGALVQYELRNPNPGEPIGVTAGFSVEGGAWKAATVEGNASRQFGGPQSLVWRSDVDTPEASGATVVVAITPEGGETAISAAFTVDNTSPSVSLDALKSPQSVSKLVITGLTEADAVVDIRVDGVNAGSATPSADGKFRYETGSLADGPHTIVAIARTGRLESDPATLAVVVDATPPSVTIVSPADSAKTIPTLTPTIQAVVSSPGGIARVSLRLNGASVPATFDPATGSVSYAPDEPLVSGRVYLLTVEAVGSNSLVGSAARFFTPTVTGEDKTAPVASGLTPANGSAILTATPTISFALTDAQSAVDIASVTVTVDGAPLIATVTPRGERDVDVSAPTTNVLADGDRAVEAAFKDALGNAGSAKWTFKVATAKPAAPVVALPDRFTNKQPHKFSGTAVAGTDVTVVVNGSPRGTIRAPESGEWSLDVRFRSDGEKVVQAYATNAAGVASDLSEPKTLVFDTQAPILALVNPSLGAPTGDLKPRFNGEVSDLMSGVDFDSLTVEINAATVATTVDRTTGRFAYDPPEPFANGSKVPLKIVAKDLAGNKTELAGNVSFDTRLGDVTPPVISAVRANGKELVAGSVVAVTGAELAVTFVVTDDRSDVAEVLATFDGVPVTVTRAGENASLSVALTEGRHSVVLQASDARGNSATPRAFDVTTDASTTTPTLTVPSLTNVADLVVEGSNVEAGATVTLLVNGVPVDARVTGSSFRSASVKLREGENAIAATAKDASGNTATATAAVTLDVTNPFFAFVEPLPGALLGAGKNAIRASFSDASGVDLSSVNVTVDGETVTVDTTDSGFTFTAAQPFAGAATGKKRHLVVVALRDKAGNAALDSMAFDVDSAPPIIQGLTPRSGITVSTRTPTISATLVDEELDRTSLRFLFGPVGGTLEDVTASATVSRLSGQVTYFAPTLADKTTYAVQIEIKDKAGNAASVTDWRFTVDSTARDANGPTITFVYPTPNGLINDRGLDRLLFNLGDDSEIDPNSVFIFLNDAKRTRPLSLGRLVSGGAASFNRETGDVQLDGSRFFVPLQVTRGGFNLDPLELSSLERSLGGGGASFDPLELSSLERSLGGGKQGSFDPLELSSLERSLAGGGGGALGVGTNNVGIQVSDKSGNVSFAPWPFAVSVQVPNAPVFAGLPTASNASTITVKGSVPDFKGPLPGSVTVKVNSVAAGTAQVADLSGSFELKNVQLKSGRNDVTAIAQDAAGNLSAASAASIVTFDVVAPTVSVDPIAALSATKNLTVTGRVTDNTTGALGSASISVNGTPIVLPTAQGAFTQIVALSDGENAIVVKAVDAAGNASESATFKVVVTASGPTTAPPMPTATSTSNGKGLRIVWSADANAAAYNLYRGAAPIANTSGLTPIAANLNALAFTDTTVTAGKTFYYAVGSVNAAGLTSPTVVSPSLNVALITSSGGEASSSAVRVTVPSRSLFTNALQPGSVEIASASGLPALANAVSGSAVSILGKTALGDVVTAFAKPVTATLNVPTGVSVTAEWPKLYRLAGASWELLPEKADAESRAVSVSLTGSATFQFANNPIAAVDLNGDGRVDIVDLVTLARKLGEPAAGSTADINGDGMIDIVDLVSVARRFGESTGAASPTRLLPTETSVVVSLVARPLADGTTEVSIEAESDIALGGYEMRVLSSDAGVSLNRMTAGDALGSSVYWMVPSQRPNDATAVAVRLDLGSATSSSPTRGALARFIVQTDDMTSERIAEIVQLRDVRFSDTTGNRLGYRFALPSATQPESLRNALYANYPNPFNPETWIPFSLAQASDVTIRVFDANGGLVREMALGARDAGDYVSRDRAAHWDGRNATGERVASGVYYYHLTAGSFTETRRLVIVK